jgi:hypothetical protein
MKKLNKEAGEVWLLDVTAYRQIKKQEQEVKDQRLQELRSVGYRRFAIKLRAHLSIKFGEDEVYEHLNNRAVLFMLKSSEL